MEQQDTWSQQSQSKVASNRAVSRSRESQSLWRHRSILPVTLSGSPPIHHLQSMCIFIDVHQPWLVPWTLYAIRLVYSSPQDSEHHVASMISAIENGRLRSLGRVDTAERRRRRRRACLVFLLFPSSPVFRPACCRQPQSFVDMRVLHSRQSVGCRPTFLTAP